MSDVIKINRSSVVMNNVSGNPIISINFPDEPYRTKFKNEKDPNKPHTFPVEINMHHADGSVTSIGCQKKTFEEFLIAISAKATEIS